MIVRYEPEPNHSGVNRLSAPMLAKMLDDLIRLLMANLDEFVVEVAAFPLDDYRREFPAEVIP